MSAIHFFWEDVQNTSIIYNDTALIYFFFFVNFQGIFKLGFMVQAKLAAKMHRKSFEIFRKDR